MGFMTILSQILVFGLIENEGKRRRWVVLIYAQMWGVFFFCKDLSLESK